MRDDLGSNGFIDGGLGIAVWLGWEVAELKQEVGKAIWPEGAMVETEAALQELMDELDKSGKPFSKSWTSGT